MIDSHAHTNFDAFDDDRAAMYERARAAGVLAIIEVGVGLDGSKQACARAQAEPMVHAAAGLHPTGLDGWEEAWDEFVALFAQTGPARPIAVGECGLDYYWMKSPKDIQADAFLRQLDFAQEKQLPYIVHCREAEDDLVPLLTAHGYARGVVHCFGGTAEHAQALLEYGLHLSFCGNVTYKSAAAMREVAATVPLDRLLLETDSPFLAPVPKRGKRNEPSFVAHTARFLADLKGVDLDTLTKAATDNTRALFLIEA